MENRDETQPQDSALTRFLDEQGRYLTPEGPLDPPDDGNAVATLLGFLERQRATLAWKCSGLDTNGLRATAGASSMTLGGMLKHLARFEDDMSTEWLQGREQLPPWQAVDWESDHDWDWRSASADAPEELYRRWQDAVTRSRALFAAAAVAGGAEWRGGAADDVQVGLPSLRYILLNMIEEYARHNGHADLIRESVDGLVGHDPPG